jgi:lipoprotein-anchoring transpeptidase ErfK/SrfK
MYRFFKFMIAGFIAAGLYGAAVPEAKAEWINPANVDSTGHYLGASVVPRRTVDFETRHPPGTIIVRNSERRLYLVLENGRAIRYGVGVGRPGFSWTGSNRITMKREWPDWRPPASMRRRQPDLPVFMAGGINNPLGARALYIGSTLYRIHGSNEPHTIGQAVSSGCIRMTNRDVEHLYERVRVGARVIVEN